MKIIALFLVSLAFGQGKVVSTDVTSGPKIDVNKDLLAQANDAEKKFHEKLPDLVKACGKKHGPGAQAPEGAPDAQKLEQCVIAAVRSSYLPVIKKGFPDYESVCRLDCTPPATNTTPTPH